jgi:hypothetical protein
MNSRSGVRVAAADRGGRAGNAGPAGRALPETAGPAARGGRSAAQAWPSARARSWPSLARAGPASPPWCTAYLSASAPPQESAGQGSSPTPPRTFGETLQIRLDRAAELEKVVYAAVALTLIVAGCSLAVAAGGGWSTASARSPCCGSAAPRSACCPASS